MKSWIATDCSLLIKSAFWSSSLIHEKLDCDELLFTTGMFGFIVVALSMKSWIAT